VEIFLLLLVLAILVATVCPKIFSHDSRPVYLGDVAALCDLSAMKTAIDAFQVDTGRYPKGTNGLLELLQKPPGATNWHGPYLEKIFQDPWGHVYRYDSPGKHNTDAYDLWSLGGPPRPNTPLNNWSRPGLNP
jgi:general secretion pathway protein G